MRSIFPFPRAIWRRAVVIGGILLPVAPAAAQGLAQEKTLPLALAREAAGAALAACEADGHRVSVAVVDRAGLVEVLLKGDGAGPHTLDSSSRKAYTALSLRRSTAELVELVRKRPEAAGLRDMNEKILLLGGGLPITAGGEVIGGIGVGGAPGGRLDEACARAGLDAIRDRLR
ncbi:MAG: heme-binding protein [Kiloniellaceae bacterium]